VSTHATCVDSYTVVEEWGGARTAGGGRVAGTSSADDP